MDALQRIFENHFAESVIITLAVLVGLVVLVYWVTSVWHKIKNQPCDDHAKRLDRHDAKINKLIELDGKINGIMTAIDSFTKPNKPQIIQSMSPLNIAPYGQQIADDLELERHIDDNWDYASKQIDEKSKGSKNPYDIQQICFDIAYNETEKMISTEGFDALKRKAFSEGIALYGLQQLVGLILRNRYFKEHSIAIDDIDKHDPSKQDDKQQQSLKFDT